MNTAYRNIILARAKAAVDAANAVANIEHKVIKGQLREIVIRDLFRPLLPSDVEVGTGVIISATNRQSKEQDVIIYDKQILPPVLLEHKGLLPIECALYTIEVKSRLTANELRTSDISAKELEGFEYQSGEYDEHDRPVIHTVERLISTILAFGSDLKSDEKTEIERYDEFREPGLPSIKAICVVGEGYWFWHKDSWRTVKPTYPLEEVIDFIAGVMNTYRRIAATRKEPRLGRYLTDK